MCLFADSALAVSRCLFASVAIRLRSLWETGPSEGWPKTRAPIVSIRFAGYTTSVPPQLEMEKAFVR